MEALRKPVYQLCCHAGEGETGCAIYAQRPVACRAYTCLWLEGEFSEADQPNRIGLAFDLPSNIEDHPDYRGVTAICARELWPGSRHGARAATLLIQLSRAMVVRFSGADGKTQLMGPAHLIELLVQRAGARREATSTRRDEV